MKQTNKAVYAATLGEFRSIREKNVFKDVMCKRALEVGFNPGDTLIRNIYRVLMSRGKYGCYIYCCDPKVSEYFKRFMID